MSTNPDLSDPRIAAALAGCDPYLTVAMGRAARLARRLHAHEVAPEHALCALLDDEDCAAHRALVNAFADPETISAEVMALAPGILVVGSGRSLPFSVRGARALEGARKRAADRRAVEVAPSDLLLAAVDCAQEELQRALAEGGWSRAGLEALDPGAEVGDPVGLDGSPIHAFSERTKRACAVACRIAIQHQRSRIGPVHLAYALLELEPELQEASGLNLLRTRSALRGRDDDDTPLPDRALAAEDELAALVDGLEGGADTLDLLVAFQRSGPSGVRLLLEQQRLTAEGLYAARRALRDPELPAPGQPPL